MKKNIIIFSFVLIGFNLGATSQVILNTESLAKLTLEELMNVKVTTGNITGIELSKIPVSYTHITSEQISITPFRNLYDLLEVYVPGFIWMNHYDSPHFGIRGLISDRNSKSLLLVNGRNMNQKAHNGTTSEMENWDLNDIESIDIIRGPGAVTYGPGAVSGIINIKTKHNIDNEDKLQVGTQYFYPYSSKGVNLAFSTSLSKFHFYTYASIVSTNGIDDHKVFNGFVNNDFGYISEDTTRTIWSGLNGKPSTYFRDYNDIPQIKIQTEITYDDDNKFWFRYTTAGSTQFNILRKSSTQIGLDTKGYPVLSSPQDLMQNQNKHFTLSFENSTNYDNEFSINSLISYDTETFSRRGANFFLYSVSDSLSGDKLKEIRDINSLINKLQNFSESELLIKVTANKKYNNLSLALGVEYSLNSWGAPWGESDDNIRMGDKSNFISGKNSIIYNFNQKGYFNQLTDNNSYFVGNGWITSTFAILTEAYYNINDDLNFLLSGRLDKDTYSQTLFSPRIALIYNVNDENVIKLIAQKSQRMNTAEQLYEEHIALKSSEPETLKGLELIWSRIENNTFRIQLSSFYNKINILSWYDKDTTTRSLGILDLAGFELETEYQTEIIKIGFNHSFVKQLNWKLSDGLSISAISYSDYKLITNIKNDTITIAGYGNNLNNNSNNTTKFYINFALFDNKFNFHFDARYFWNFDGEKEGLKMVENYLNQSNNVPDAKHLYNTLNDKNVWGTDFRLNFSMSYNLSSNYNITFLIQNLLTNEDSKRYTYDDGIKYADALYRNGFVEEPMMLGISLKAKF